MGVSNRRVVKVIGYYNQPLTKEEREGYFAKSEKEGGGRTGKLVFQRLKHR